MFISGQGLLVILLVGLVAGWLAGKIDGLHRNGNPERRAIGPLDPDLVVSQRLLFP